MLADMKPTREYMDGLLNLGQTNTYNTTLTAMKTLTIHEFKEKRRKNPRKNHNDTTKNDPKKKDDGKVG